MASPSVGPGTQKQELYEKLVDTLTAIFGSHPGYRPVHAKGMVCEGTFTPTAAASSLTYDEHGEVESGKVFLQLKATDRVQWVAKGEFIGLRLDRADLHSWLTEFQPVILVVYDAPADRAYWLYVQAYFAKLPGFKLNRAGKTVTVRIPRTNLLDPEAIRTFARYRDLIVAQFEGRVSHEE